MAVLAVDNYVIETPLIDILYDIRDELGNGKLKDIQDKGQELVVTCPNDEHSGGQEDTPDNHINISQPGVGYGVFHCFACDEKGDFVKFVALCFSTYYGKAKAWLIRRYGKMAFVAANLGEDIKLKTNSKPKYLSQDILSGLEDWTPYLSKRHLSRDICEKFHVKYDPAARQVVFPVYDAKGNLLMAPRRSVDSKFFVLGKDIDKPLYGMNVIEKNNVRCCLVVEGPIDMLSCWSHGVPAIATLGAPSDEQIAKINKSCLTRIILACDNDDAGRAFNYKIKKDLDSRLFADELSWPMNCKDANDLTDEQWDALINKCNLPKLF